MSLDCGLKILNLEKTERIGHTEYCDHDSLIKHITGINPNDDNEEKSLIARQKFYEWAEYDFLFYNNDGTPWQELGRTTDMGHAIYAENGSDFREVKDSPFKTTEEVLSFNAVQEYGLPDIEENAHNFNKQHQILQNNFPDIVIPGGYYKTLVSACIQSFGWDMFLLALGEDEKRFGEEVLEGFFNYTLSMAKAWSTTGIKAFICHDDFVWANGPFANPSWYRKHIIPRYKIFWTVLKEKGIKVLFCSDGNFNEFIDDISGAGADGFIFEPLTDFEKIASSYGKSHVIIGNVDCRILTYGTRQDIEREVKRCIEPGLDCPGFMIAVGNHIPPEVPIDNALYYFELVKKFGRR